MTRQKTLIIDILRASRSHPTAAEIYDAARQRLPSISLGTVYRNLASLCAEGEVVRLVSHDGPDRYDFMYADHWHATCSVCGRIVDIPTDAGLLSSFAGRCGDGMTPRGIEVNCICDACRDVAMSGSSAQKRKSLPPVSKSQAASDNK